MEGLELKMYKTTINWENIFFELKFLKNLLVFFQIQLPWIYVTIFSLIYTNLQINIIPLLIFVLPLFGYGIYISIFPPSWFPRMLVFVWLGGMSNGILDINVIENWKAFTALILGACFLNPYSESVAINK